MAKPLTIFAKHFILDLWQGSEYASAVIKGAMPRLWCYVSCFLSLWKLMLPHLRTLWQTILKVSEKHSFCNNWRYQHWRLRSSLCLFKLENFIYLVFLRLLQLNLENESDKSIAEAAINRKSLMLSKKKSKLGGSSTTIILTMWRHWNESWMQTQTNL